MRVEIQQQAGRITVGILEKTLKITKEPAEKKDETWGPRYDTYMRARLETVTQAYIGRQTTGVLLTQLLPPCGPLLRRRQPRLRPRGIP